MTSLGSGIGVLYSGLATRLRRGARDNGRSNDEGAGAISSQVRNHVLRVSRDGVQSPRLARTDLATFDVQLPTPRRTRISVLDTEGKLSLPSSVKEFCDASSAAGRSQKCSFLGIQDPRVNPDGASATTDLHADG